MPSLARLSSLSLLVALAGSMAVTQGCAADGEGEASATGAGTQAPITGKAAVDIPFYFGVPADSLTEMSAAQRKHPFRTGWSQGQDEKGGFVANVGLRTITVDAKADPKGARRLAGEALGKAGVIQTGDIILSFRPELARTIAYAHIQMGTTHAGIARVANGVARSVDQPLDTEHNSPGQSFQAPHYMGLGAFHIVRPRGLTEAQRANVDKWLQLAERMIGSEGRPGFNDNYLTPALSAFAKSPADPQPDEIAKLATTIGKGLIAGNIRSLLPDLNPAPEAPGEQQLFCSEFAYHVLALRNCSPEDVRGAGDVATCASTPFEPQNLVGPESAGGLGEGPLFNILVGNLGEDGAKEVFSSPNPFSAALSAGHKKANAMRTAPQPGLPKGIMGALEAFYPEAIKNGTGGRSLPAGIGVVNQTIPANYSPTAFLIETMKPSANRSFDYVATVVFAKDDATLAAAKALPGKDIPHTANP
jgi:hypothetical protein